MATQSISQDLSDLLTTKNFDPTYLDKSGRDAEPADAVTYSFDWTSSSGKNYGTLAIVLGDGNDMMVFFGDNLGRSMENPEDKNEWFRFLEQLSNFATQHRYTFSPKDLNRLKHTMAGIAAIKEGLFEGYYGTRRISYVGEQTQARLVIKHNRMLGENDKRFRYVESLFIETNDDERFKLPFTKLAGGRAMLEHVRQGGKPYDIRGNHICEMVTEINLLSRFNRASHAKMFEGSTAELVQSARSFYNELQENLKQLSSGRGYNTYFESWSPADIGSEDALVEDIKTLFVEQTIDSRIEQALPLLARIQQQGTAMKEVQVFEAWINNMAEGTWSLPDTPEQQARLQKLMSQELPAGPDGTNATEQLYDLVGDDLLFDLIQAAAGADPNTNIWDNAEIISRLSELGVDVGAITQQGAEQAPEQSVAEGYYDLPNQDDFPGMQTIDLSSNPSFKDIIDRYTQLVYQGHTSETSPEEDQEYDAIEQYVAQRFGEKGSAHLQKAGEVSYWGRDDGKGSGHIRSSNLGRPSQPSGDFRTTKAGKMHGQDAKAMKGRVSDRLGQHPAPNLPESNDDPMNYNAAVTGSYYESREGDALLARIKSLALLK